MLGRSTSLPYTCEWAKTAKRAPHMSYMKLLGFVILVVDPTCTIVYRVHSGTWVEMTESCIEDVGCCVTCPSVQRPVLEARFQLRNTRNVIVHNSIVNFLLPPSNHWYDDR